MRRQWRLWWGLRTVRERRLLLVCAAAVILTLLWFAVIRPMDDALADARRRHARAVLDLATAQSMAGQITALRRSRPATSEVPLATLLGERAAAAGFAIARITPQANGSVGIALDAARAPALFGWLALLERGDGLVVQRLTTRTNSDATIAIEATIRRRAG